MKTLNNKKGLTLRSSKGFTLIEVVLVLAIGGLIFLLAFIAFQQVSANRRDTQRRADGGRIIAELANAKGDGFVPNNQGTLDTFKDTYLTGMQSPANAAYTLTWKSDNTAVTATHSSNANTMYVGVGKRCNGNNGFITSGANNAVITILEKGWACRDDN